MVEWICGDIIGETIANNDRESTGKICDLNPNHRGGHRYRYICQELWTVHNEYYGVFAYAIMDWNCLGREGNFNEQIHSYVRKKSLQKIIYSASNRYWVKRHLRSSSTTKKAFCGATLPQVMDSNRIRMVPIFIKDNYCQTCYSKAFNGGVNANRRKTKSSRK